MAVTRAPDARAIWIAGRADTAGAAVHEQALAGPQAGLGEDRVVGGGEDLGRAAGGGPVQRVGHRHELALVHDGQLGLPAPADDAHDPVPEAQSACAAGPQAEHLSGQLEAGDVGRALRAGPDTGPGAASCRPR